MQPLVRDQLSDVVGTQSASGRAAAPMGDFKQPSTRRQRRWDWTAPGSMFVAAGIMAVLGFFALGALTVVVALLVASWLLGYRGRVHRWPALLGDPERRRPSNG